MSDEIFQPALRDGFGIGLTLPQLGEHVDRSALRRFCEEAERLGFASLWVQEHLFYPLEPQSPYAARPGTPIPAAYRTIYSPFEVLSMAAAWTSQIILGTGVIVGGYHRPVELAQRVATLDRLSDGRLICGLSVGWSKDEHDLSDVEYSTRGRRLDELVRALRACWGPDPVEFVSEHFRIPPSIVRPKPLQRPHPPLLSGMRAPAGLRRTAELFDIWNPASGTVEQIRATAEHLDAQRPEGAAPIRVFQRVFSEPPLPGGRTATVGDLIDAARAARDAGFRHLIIDTSFTSEVTSPEEWASFPARLAPVLEA